MWSSVSYVVSTSTRVPCPAATMLAVALAPSTPGMRRSMSTRSGRSDAASSTASAPSDASPTTSMPGAWSSRPTMPARTMGWSSATTMRMVSVIPHASRGVRARPRHDDPQPRAAVGAGAELERAADEGGAVADPGEAEPLLAGRRVAGPDAVVGDGEHDLVARVGLRDVDRRRARLRVLAHVRERLLGAAEQHDLELAVEPCGIRRHRDRHARLALERRSRAVAAPRRGRRRPRPA